MAPRQRLLLLTNRAQSVLIATIVLGTCLAFGGAVWWARPVLAALTVLLALTCLGRFGLEGRFRLLKSPLTLIGFATLALGLAQLAPWPARLLERVSPRSGAVHGLGTLPDRALADDPAAELPAPERHRAPPSVDRSATLRWVAGAAACLVLFCSAAHFADRFGRAMVVWGSVVGALFVCTTFGVVQLVGNVHGLYGFIEAGAGPAWAPTTADLMRVPNVTVLRGTATDNPQGATWAVRRPDPSAAIGGLMGGPGAFLALASIGLPLALALTLHLLAPRGSREGLIRRLRLSPTTGLVVLMACLTIVTAVLVGLVAGPILSVPLVAGLLLAGIPGARAAGLRGAAVGVTLVVVAALIAGVALGETAGRPLGVSPLAERGGWTATRVLWTEAARIARDFPIIGSGFGTFASIHPYYKQSDESPTTAWSSLVQWCAESGVVGVALLALAVAWSLIKVPGAVRRVGSGDRMLVFGLLGSVAGFGLFSVVHWTVELAAVALAASAVGGTCNRWLAGGTDLFVERV